jgi:hypothetical protein
MGDYPCEGERGTPPSLLPQERAIFKDLPPGTQPRYPEDGVMKRLVVLVGFAVVAVTVQVDSAIADAPSMKQALFDPKGHEMDWSCGGKTGRSLVFFREDGKRIVTDIRVIDIEDVDINNPVHYGSGSCTTDARLTDTGIIFNGCGSVARDIPLTYDPEDRKTPFKGSGVNCPRIELGPR